MGHDTTGQCNALGTSQFNQKALKGRYNPFNYKTNNKYLCPLTPSPVTVSSDNRRPFLTQVTQFTYFFHKHDLILPVYCKSGNIPLRSKIRSEKASAWGQGGSDETKKSPITGGGKMLGRSMLRAITW